LRRCASPRPSSHAPADSTAALAQRCVHILPVCIGARCRALIGKLHVATTFGYGPRYLHSTGQLHKGGPPTGAFLQIVDETPPFDLAIPGKPYSFGTLLAAQALGDLQSLRRRHRRVARITLAQLEEVAAR